MRNIELTHGKIALIDEEDWDKVKDFHWYLVKEHRTHYAKAYDYSYKPRKSIRMHRLILGIKDSSIKIDHEDGNGLNNQKTNLRKVTIGQNNKNKQNISSNNKSGYIGVYWYKAGNCWRAQVRCEGKAYHLGNFKCPKEAALVRDKKAIELFGEYCGYLNFPD